MNNTVFILKHQTLLDISIQELGDLEGVYQLMLDNNISIMENTPGKEIEIKQDPINKVILNLYIKNEIIPATGKLEDSSILLQENGEGLLLEDGQNILL